jgi:hypothetical protein
MRTQIHFFTNHSSTAIRSQFTCVVNCEQSFTLTVGAIPITNLHNIVPVDNMSMPKSDRMI